MRSSIGDTKILAFYFILLYLFLKVKMCVGTVGAASGNSASSSDSDINYYESDESFQPAQTAAPPLNPVPDPDSLGVVHQQHHVRHHGHHHHAKNRHIVQAERASRAHRSNSKPAAWTMASQRRWPHRRHVSRAQQKHAEPARRTFGSTGSQSSVLSSGDGLRTRNNRSSSGKTIHQNPSHNHLRRLGQSSSSAASQISNTKHKSPKKPSHSQYSKNYFEELLNSYKTYSPYYKKDSSQLTKSMDAAKTNCDNKRCKHEEVKPEENDDDYYYEYDDDDDDDDDDGDSEEEEDNEYDDAETQGDAGYSTTASPAINEVDVTNDYPQHHKQNQGSHKNDNSLYENTQDASRDKSSLSSYSNRVDVAPESKMIQKEAEAKQMASSHIAKVRNEGNCSVPKPKIVLASTDPTKQYIPHCTILHRCGDDVGCCPPSQTCAASNNTTVELYFFVKAVGSRSSIERLSFVNHTKCACVNRVGQSAVPQNRRAAASPLPVPSTVPPPPVCTCPSFFQRVIDDDNRCFCDCSSSDTQCDQFKRGLEHFSMENRRCINMGRCEVPICEHGHYNKAKGKCPTERDRLSITFKG